MVERIENLPELRKKRVELLFKETVTKWTPTINIDDKTIKYNPTPRLLGVIFDSSLCFGPHVISIEERVAPKLIGDNCVFNTTWG